MPTTLNVYSLPRGAKTPKQYREDILSRSGTTFVSEREIFVNPIAENFMLNGTVDTVANSDITAAGTFEQEIPAEVVPEV